MGSLHLELISKERTVDRQAAGTSFPRLPILQPNFYTQLAHDAYRKAKRVTSELPVRPLVKHHDPHSSGNNEQVFAQTADMSGTAMPATLIFLYSVEPHTVDVRIQINGTSLLS